MSEKTKNMKAITKSEIEPIELTEEWLLKGGGKKKNTLSNTLQMKVGTNLKTYTANL